MPILFVRCTARNRDAVRRFHRRRAHRPGGLASPTTNRRQTRGNRNRHLAPAQPALGRDPRGARSRSGYPCRSPVIHAARVRQHPPKLMPPPRPRGGITAAKDRTTRHTVAASLAPWRAAIAEVRAPHRAARIVAPSTQHAARAPAAGAQSHAAHTNAASGAPQLHRSNHSVLIPWTVSQPQSPPQPRHSNHSELIPWTVSRRQSPPRPHRSNHSELIP